MSIHERLQANNAELREAIEMAANLPDAGGGDSGGAEETCTVRIVANEGDAKWNYSGYVAQTSNDSFVVDIKQEIATSYDFTIANVRCNSIMSIGLSCFSETNIGVDGDAELVYFDHYGLFFVRGHNGETITINYICEGDLGGVGGL